MYHLRKSCHILARLPLQPPSRHGEARDPAPLITVMEAELKVWRYQLDVEAAGELLEIKNVRGQDPGPPTTAKEAGLMFWKFWLDRETAKGEQDVDRTGFVGGRAQLSRRAQRYPAVKPEARKEERHC